MLYPMVPSVALVFVEIVKKMPSQWHCSLPSSPFTIKNHFGMRPHLSISLLAQPTTPQRANKIVRACLARSLVSYDTWLCSRWGWQRLP
jgi:hypothetical protein